MRDCYIVGAGDFAPERFNPLAGDFIIAADAGITRLDEIGAAPNLIVGDFDSLGAVPDRPNVVVCPVEKDDTDMFIAVKEALRRGCDRLMLFGGTGGERMDHTLANIQVLAFAAQRNMRAFLFGRGFVLTAICGGTLSFDERYSGDLSVFCHGDLAAGVSESGVKYPLRSVRMSGNYPLGVSNSFNGAASISVEEGVLLIYWQDNATLPLPVFSAGDSEE